MSDNNSESLSFGIVDTISASSQELVDAFLDGDSSMSTKLEDIKDIKEPDAPKPESKAAEKPKGNLKTPEDEPEAPGGDFDLDNIKDADEEEEEAPAKPAKKQPKAAEKEQEEEEQPEPGSDEFNPFAAFSKELYNLGAFLKTGDDDEEPEIPSTPEEFLETFNQQVGMRAEMAVDNFISRFGEDYQHAFDAIFVKGVDPKDYFQAYNNVQSFSEMDLTAEENQISVVRQTLRDLEYEEEDIKTEIDRLKDYGDLEEVAKKHHKVLVKKEAQKLEELAQRQEQVRAQQIAVKRQFAANVVNVLQEKVRTKDFDGIPINPRLAEEVQDMLVTEKWKNSAGEPLTDFDVEILSLKKPENHAMKVKLALLLKILKNDPTLSTIKKSAVTKQTNQLFNEVVRNQPKSNVTKTGSSHWSNL